MILLHFREFSGDFLPFTGIDFREKGIRIKRLINPGQIEFGGMGHELPVNRCPAYYKVLLMLIAKGKSLIDGMGHFATLKAICRIIRYYNVSSVLQRTRRQGMESIFPHDHSMAGGDLFKTLHVSAYMPQQFVVFSNAIVFGNGYDDGDVYHVLDFKRK